ncbi:MAG TPA: formylmethanofuran dehydrogenase [Methylophilus sp.]|nr:formylmethanofuran dehydrogenase [Methylophilus sp.]HQQ33944.1 formylmethanofuran dehydrogenase [Methylophilus sp.]
MSITIKTLSATCPACGLLCDDIRIEGATAHNACAKGITFFSQTFANLQPQIAGKPETQEEAIHRAAEILKKSQRPVLAGLSTDIHGMRALTPLANKLKADLQHMNHASLQRNMQAMQSAGWFITTLSEVKNRADVIVCIGTDVVSHNPRFFERFVWVKDAMFTDPNTRKIVYLGGEKPDTTHGRKGAWILPFKAADLPDTLAALNALLLNKPLKADSIAGIAMADLQKLAETLKQAKYAVLAWAAKDLDFPHASLAVQQITSIVGTLNQTTRAAGLPLGGSDGDYSINNVHAWQTGKVLPDLQDAKPDAQIWVNSYNADAPPSFCHTPTIVLGNANTSWSSHADVFIPVATPGLDCSGTMMRVDSSISLPLKQVRESGLPTLADVVRKLEALLP